MFFFQAEDGIRYCLLSRGLGDVYKRQNERTVVIEFDSVDAAIAAHDSPGYAAALAALGDGAVREIRIVEGA